MSNIYPETPDDIIYMAEEIIAKQPVFAGVTGSEDIDENFADSFAAVVLPGALRLRGGHLLILRETSTGETLGSPHSSEACQSAV